MSQSDSEDIRTESGSDPADTLYTRRTVLRRSFLGISTVGFTGFLAACGGGDDDDDEDEDNEGDSNSDEGSNGEEENGDESEED